jgi:hypothetical protein
MRSTKTRHFVFGSLATILAFGLAGCTGGTASHVQKGNESDKGQAHVAASGSEHKADAEIAAERAKLSAEDRALVDAQEWCVISDDERIGSMGPPIKLIIKGQPVFICCKGCRKKAEADPDKTLAKLEELKAKKKQQVGQP